MAVDLPGGSTDPSFTNGAGTNTPVQTITHIDAFGVSTIRYQRVAAVVYTIQPYANTGAPFGGTEGAAQLIGQTAWTAFATPTSQMFLNEERFDELRFTTTGRLQAQVRTCDGSDGSVGTAAQCGVDSLTRNVGAANTFRFTSDTNRETRDDVTVNPNFVAPPVVGPTALITGDTAAVRPATIQLTDASTAGTNPITSRVWSSSIQTMVDVNQSGLVTAFGALPATITLVVSDAFGNSDSDTHSVAFTNPAAPTIFVAPFFRMIAAAGGAGVAFMVSTTGTGTVTVSGTATWLTVNADGSWSATENTGAARSDTFRFTVTDGLSQSDFQEVDVDQAQAVAMATCFTYTFTHGTTGTGTNIGSYVLCDGTVQANTTLPDGFSACIQEGTQTSVGGSWSQGAGC